MRWTVLYFFLILVVSRVFAQAEKVVSDAKFDSLANEANAVVLLDEHVFEVEGVAGALLYNRTKILIKNRHAQHFCELTFGESDFVKVDDLQAALYDTLGNLIKELDEDDIEKGIYTPGYNSFSNHTFKHFELYFNKYPFIIEYSYTYKFNSLFFWPDWKPQTNVPVKYSSFKLKNDDNIPYKIHSIGITAIEKKIIDDGDALSLWELSNIPPSKEEDYIAPEDEIQMALLFAPEKFVLAETSGSNSDWNQYAGWYRNLAKEKYNLDEKSQQEILSLVKNQTDAKQIIRILYKYLQEKTHYVTINLDIGGWQPYSAQSVLQNNYGDCKDLSTLMVAMLNVVGVKAYPALALTRDKGIVYEEFPSNQFNHVITFVPLEKDTVWLECTADFIDPEDTPYKIEGIKALVVKDQSGELITTPQKPADKNKWASQISGSLDDRGKLNFQSKITLTGNQKNNYKYMAGVNKPDDLKEKLQKQFSAYASNLQIGTINFNGTTQPDESYELNVDGNYSKFASQVGKRIFINPNIYNRITEDDLPDEDVREFPVYYNYPYADIDSMMIVLPEGYILESGPEQKNLAATFGSYTTNYSVQNNIFSYKRSLQITSKKIMPEEYVSYLEFMRDVIKTDKSSFIFKR